MYKTKINLTLTRPQKIGEKENQLTERVLTFFVRTKENLFEYRRILSVRVFFF